MTDHRGLPLDALRAAFGPRLQENVVMANYITAHVGGPADAFIIANTTGELADTVRRLWDMQLAFTLLGSGSNLLVADAGIRGLVVLNRTRAVKIDAQHVPPTVWAESGANLSAIARQVALRGLSGLEWAATIPGTVGGAVYGNAGAHGSDTAACLLLADILHRDWGRQEWPVERLEYAYRSSLLKRSSSPAVILAARIQLAQSTTADVKARMETFTERRRATQPPGASLGSMFKNPPGDFAGRLIEAAGLKGHRAGAAQISPIHANFFLNHGGATAADIFSLIQTAKKAVLDQFHIHLELEVELAGDWEAALPAQQGQS